MFNGPETAALLKNFALERPSWLHEISQWPLPLVLPFLKGVPFEPLEEASLEDLTRKIIVLIVLASGTCHSEVHSFLCLPSAVSFF